MGLGQYNGLVEYCCPHTASSVFLILVCSWSPYLEPCIHSLDYLCVKYFYRCQTVISSILYAHHSPLNQLKKILFLFFGFSTGLVRLYIAGLPLRSCRTIGAPSVQRSAQCAFFSVPVAAGFKPMSLSLGGGCLNRYPILTPQLWRIQMLTASLYICNYVCNI